MAIGPDPNGALVALNRFGFGAHPGDVGKAAADPRGFLRAELRTPDVALISLDDPANADLVGTTTAIEKTMAANYQRKLQSDRPLAPLMPGVPLPHPGQTRAKTAEKMPNVEQVYFLSEARARFDKAAAVEAGFVERLVTFWSNHFCVSVSKDSLVRASAGAFEREAIRPYALGRFVDMLMAVERHPAMLVYLDNQQSIGPDSRAGHYRKRGLNENLAREILELHTLGVGTGYTQGDVTAFARVLTGWTIAGREGRNGEPGSVIFNANAHEPGAQMVLGRAIGESGMGQSEAVLTALARDPATALHIATKLARHFVSDNPPDSLVARLAKAFRDHDGDLRALANALIDAPESWNTPPTKIRSPYDYLVAVRRATHPAPMPDPKPMLGGLNGLGQPLWQPPGPNGHADTTAAWASAEGMKVRLDIAWLVARQTKNLGNPDALLDAIIGPAASPETRQAVGRAESKQQGFALLLMSPEFQRR